MCIRDRGRICGNLLFASGQIALSPETGELVGTTIEEQTAQVMKLSLIHISWGYASATIRLTS